MAGEVTTSVGRTIPTSPALHTPFVVLHVDDDVQLGASLARLLRTAGFEAVTASDGPAALASLAQVTPDVLIMDFNLHGEMDGADVAEEICHSLGHIVPTVFLSGELGNGGMPWLPGAPLLFTAKPVDAEMLLKVLESFATLGRFLSSHARR